MTRYLALILGFLFILVVSYFYSMLEAFLAHDLNLLSSTGLLQIFSGIGLTGLLISTLFFPRILYGLPRYPETLQALKADEEPEKVKSREVRKYSPHFENDYLVHIQQKTDSCMMEFKPYLQHDCNLASLARVTQIPAHHLAYYFSKVKNQSFNDYRNGYRVDHAKKLMQDGIPSKLTLEAIGMLSGFSSRKTFLTVFKKAEKLSPSEYTHRRKIQA